MEYCTKINTVVGVATLEHKQRRITNEMGKTAVISLLVCLCYGLNAQSNYQVLGYDGTQQQENVETQNNVLKNVTNDEGKSTLEFYLKYDAPSIPSNKPFYAQVKIENQCSSCTSQEYSLFKSSIHTRYLATKRLMSSSQSEFDNADKGSKEIYIYILDKVMYIANIYSNGVVSNHVTYKYHFSSAIFGKPSKSVNYSNDGGSINRTDGITKELASIQASDDISEQVQVLIYYYGGVKSDSSGN